MRAGDRQGADGDERTAEIGNPFLQRRAPPSACRQRYPGGLDFFEHEGRVHFLDARQPTVGEPSRQASPACRFESIDGIDGVKEAAALP
jgi:hypothetical protein